MELKVGDVFYDEDNYKCYVVSILAEEKEPQVVYKYYGKHKQWWHYFVKSEYWLERSFELGLWKKV